eukprot:454701-Amphidinium_carterae.1
MRQKCEFACAPSISTPSFISGAVLDAGNSAGTPSTRVVSDDTPQPDRARLRALAPSFQG